METAYKNSQPNQLADFNYYQLKVQELQEINRMMAHNLRGAAANIHMLTKVLEDGNEDKEEGSGFTKSDIYDHLRQTSQAMIATLDRLMEMNKKSIDLHHHPEACNIRECVEAVCTQLGFTLRTRHVNIIMELQQPVVPGIKVYLESIFYNLIANSLKYSAPNKVLELTIKSYLHDGKPVITVKDNGQGIDMEKCAGKLFCPFYSSDTNGIHGLGLYLVKSHVEAMGGTITVHSQLGNGTEFIMQF